ncbi:hypothetical protein Gotri_012512 [Gossypium trilobum]|uniref:HAT C-terminal dimerisation domain-containing protein n=1 Tax=Gossypium trilobum TaxID=34281 RepID=A0A7J9DQY9_9ROSI|nr:hypothetical protein [Gossypium trilobum]
MASLNTPIHVDDGFNEYESVPKRKKSTTSEVWDEMTNLECENKDELKAQCNHYFVQTNHSNFKLLFDKYVKNSKSTSSSLAGSSNVLDNDPIDSSLHQLNVNRADLGGEYDEKLELNSQINVLDYWSKISIRSREFSFLACDILAIPTSTVASESTFSMEKKVITSLRNSLKPKMVQAVVCFDEWIRTKGFSTEIDCNNDDDDEDDEDDDYSIPF